MKIPLTKISKAIHLFKAKSFEPSFISELKNASKDRNYNRMRCLIHQVLDNKNFPPKYAAYLASTARQCGLYSEANRLLSYGGNDKKTESVKSLLAGEMNVYEGRWQPEDNVLPYKPDFRHVMHFLENSLPYKTSGYTYRSHYILKNLVNIGYSVAAVTRPGFPWDSGHKNPKTSHNEEGVTYKHINTEDGASFANHPLDNWLELYIAKSISIALEWKPEILHAHSNFKNPLACRAVAKRLGIPWIYEMRGIWEDTQVSTGRILQDSDIYNYQRNMENQCMLDASAVVTISETQKKEIIARGICKDKVFVVPNAVDSKRFPKTNRNLSLASSLGLTGKRIIGYIGSLIHYEGIEILIQAYALLAKKQKDVSLLIVGDGDNLPKLQALASKTKCKDIVFTKKIKHDEVLDYYSLIDLFVISRLPYRVCQYVTPLKPIEAMSTGRPLLVSDLPALKEVIQNSGCGHTFIAGDPISLEREAKYLLDNPSKLKLMGDKAAKWARENRQWKHVCQHYTTVYDYAMSNNKTHIHDDGKAPKKKDVHKKVMNNDRIAELYYGKIFKDKPSQRRAIERINWILSQVDNGPVLDIGCSQGIVPILLARKGYYCLGLDNESPAIKYANCLKQNEPLDIQERLDFRFVSDAAYSGLDDEAYGTIMATQVLEHMSVHDSLLKEIARLLAQNGRAIFTVPMGLHPYPDHHTTFYPSNLILLVEKYFKIKKLTVFNHVLACTCTNKPVDSKSCLTDIDFVVDCMHATEAHSLHWENEYIKIRKKLVDKRKELEVAKAKQTQ